MHHQQGLQVFAELPVDHLVGRLEPVEAWPGAGHVATSAQVHEDVLFRYQLLQP